VDFIWVNNFLKVLAMQLFAKVENFIVTDVIVASQEVIDSGLFGEGWIETWVEKVDNPRKNYAGIGYTYDPQLNAFIPPQPPEGEWVLNKETCLWEEIK
jgi:hypothetical protein